MQLKWLVVRRYTQLDKLDILLFCKLFSVFKVYVALSIQWCRAEGASVPPKV